MNDVKKCVMCGAVLPESIIRSMHKKCYDCIDLTHLNILLSPERLTTIFSKKWAASLLQLKKWVFNSKSSVIVIAKATLILLSLRLI